MNTREPMPGYLVGNWGTAEIYHMEFVPNKLIDLRGIKSYKRSSDAAGAHVYLRGFERKHAVSSTFILTRNVIHKQVSVETICVYSGTRHIGHVREGRAIQLFPWLDMVGADGYIVAADLKQKEENFTHLSMFLPVWTELRKFARGYERLHGE